jgi:ABC-type lipoprotein release transport system permease subunit
MFKIALKGLLGRKKESFMLLSILFLSFLFSIVTSTFYTNSEAAKAMHRRSVYGQWQYASFGQSEGEDDNPFKEAEQWGKNRIIGYSDTLGTLASFDEGFTKLANLNLLEGRMPETVNELAVEQSQLSYFEETPTVGDEVLADTEVFIYDFEMDKEPEEIRQYIQEESAGRIMEQMTPDMRRILMETLALSGDGAEVDGQLREYITNYISVTTDTKQSKRGLEHFEDTLLLADEELLKYFYAFDLTSLIQNEASLLSVQEKTQLLKEMNDLTVKEMDSNFDELFKIGGEGHFSLKKSYIIRRTLTVTGVYSSISNAWLGEQQFLPTSLVTEAGAEKFIEKGIMQTVIAQQENFRVPVNYFLGQGQEADALAAQEKLPEAITANRLAFPPGNSTEGILAASMMGFIFFITLFGVFQLYMSQVKKRRRKLGLLRSVGATTGQIRQLLGWELIIILIITLPLALAIGIGLAWLFARGLGAQTAGYQFIVSPTILGLSILAGLVAVVLGVLQPLLTIKDIPLTGRTEDVKSTNRPSVRETLGKKVRPITNLNQVLKHHQRFTRKQSLMTQVIYTVIFTVMLLSLLLSFLSFTNYRDEVVAVNMPDYDITFHYALNRKDSEAMEKELMATGAIADIQQIIGRKQAQLVAEDWKDPLYDLTKTINPVSLEGELFITKKDTEQYPDHFTAGLRKVNLYGIKPESTLFHSMDLASGGLLQSDGFKTGQAVVMLYPSYLMADNYDKAADSDQLSGQGMEYSKILFKQTEAGELSFDFREANLLDQIEAGQVPEKIQLVYNSEIYSAVERNIVPPSRFELDLITIISELPEFGVWPFSSSLEHPVIIGSEQLVRNLTESNQYLELLKALPPNQTLVPTLYGIQRTSLWAGSGKTEASYLEVQQIAHRYGGQVNNLLADKEVRFNAALRISVMVLIVAFVIGLAALQIQLNISKARVEAERLYVGTLQSLGVSNKKLKLAYVKSGLGYSVVAVLLSHVLFVGVLAGHILITYPLELVKTNFIKLVSGQLWLYPWFDHLLVTLVFLLLGTLIYYLPLRKILKNNPINNIRQL